MFQWILRKQIWNYILVQFPFQSSFIVPVLVEPYVLENTLTDYQWFYWDIHCVWIQINELVIVEVISWQN